MNPDAESPVIPDNMQLLTNTEGVVIRRKWLSWRIAPLILMALFWNGFMVLWYTAAFHTRHPSTMTLLFPLIHVMVGLGLIYYVVATYFNLTDIVISTSQVKVTSYPIPVPGNKQVPVDAISKVFVRERVTSKGARSYRVDLLETDGKVHNLLILQVSRQAEFIAQEIRSTLGLAEA